MANGGDNMHITLETDYALRIVDCLARHNSRMGAKLLSEEVSVTLRFSLKILRKLVATRVVRSYKGTQGGYEIARPLHDISLYDIMETIEGPFVFNRCLCDDFECTQHEDKNCIYRDIFDELSADVRQKLEAITLDKMLRISDPDADADPDLQYDWEPEYAMQP
jgi:Rrf2 family protein